VQWFFMGMSKTLDIQFRRAANLAWWKRRSATAASFSFAAARTVVQFVIDTTTANKNGRVDPQKAITNSES
jgi:hypothetical protein